MKNFVNYMPDKYAKPAYTEVQAGIYRTQDALQGGECYVTSLSFEHEADRYEEAGGSPRNITQVPFEDILDKFNVFVTDFYPELNSTSETICYQEFGSCALEDIQNLRGMIGKSAYAAPYKDEHTGRECYRIVIE